MTASLTHSTDFAAGSSASSQSITIPSTAAGAVMLVFYECGNNDAVLNSISGGSGTWASAASLNDANNTTAVWKGTGVSAGTTSLTLTLSTADNPVAVVQEWASATGTLDVSATVKSSSGATSWTSNSATTTNATDFVIGAVMGWTAGSAPTVTPPSTGWTNQTAEISTPLWLQTGYQVVSSTGSFTYAGTVSPSSHYHAYVVAFQQLSSVAGAAALSATSSLTAGGAIAGAATLSATSSLTAGASVLGNSATLAASSSLAAAATETLQQSAALAATSSLTAAANLTFRPPATLAATSSLSAAPGFQAPAVTVVGSGGYALAQGFYFPYPPARPLEIAIANTAGDWMLCVATWRPLTTGTDVTVTVADDVHNFWEPTGQPSGDSAKAGVTRTAIWYAPAARAAANLQVAPTGPVLSMAAMVLDVANLSKYYSLTAITPGYANANTALSLGIGTPPSAAFMVAGLGTDLNTATIGGPGAGWTLLTPVAKTDGADHLADITLNVAWQTATTAQTAAWTSTASLDLSGVTAGILVTAPAPAQPNPNWPVIITELAPGAGVTTPPSETTWVPLSARSLSLDFTQGKQYTLGQLEAGQGTMLIDNPDGALIPPGTGAFAGIDSGTPVRQRLIWPASPTPYYVPFSGYFQRWPLSLEDDMLRGQTIATIQDVWAYAASPLDSMARQEYELDNPYAFWPLDDPAGSTSASNLAPGNSKPLVLVPSKYGTGGATATFGNSTGALLGDSSAKTTVTGQVTQPGGTFAQVLGEPGNFYTGYALACQDTGYPPISGGVTIETWASVTPNGATAGFLATQSTNTFGQGSWVTGQAVYMTVATGFSIPGGFTANTVYYVVNATSSTFQLAATYGGAAITITADGGGYLQILSAGWNPEIWSVRGTKGLIVGLGVNILTGALFMQYQTAAGVTNTVTLDSAHDYRVSNAVLNIAVAFTQTTYQVILQGGGRAGVSGTFSSALPASFSEFTLAGVADRATTGSFMPGILAPAAIFPGLLTQQRVLSHYWGAGQGMVNEAVCDRIERVLEYAGLTGRRCLLQQFVQYEGDLMVSGQDIGGQPAATSITNAASSTVPGMMAVAPTGDLFFLAKYWTWNQATRWTLGDNVAGGEIPFLPGDFATDYDPTRVVNDIQLTQLDTSAVTVPTGATASTTMAAIEAASSAQYGDQAYQQTGYLTYDGSSSYTAGGGLNDLANWLANVYAKPVNRVQAITVEASANAANSAAYTSGQAWQFWGGAAAGDMVKVNLRLPTAATSPLVTLTARISQTKRTMTFSQGGVTAKIEAVLDFAPEADLLTCDNPVTGLLSGVNCLGWLWS